MDRGGNFSHNIPFCAASTLNGNGSSRLKLDNGSQFYGATPRFPVAPHPNDFNRYPFHQPSLPLIPRRPTYNNNAPLQQHWSSNGVRTFFGRASRSRVPQQKIEDFSPIERGPCRSARMIFRDYANNPRPRPHFRGPFQNQFRVDVAHGAMQKPALLPLPPLFNGNTRSLSQEVLRMDGCSRMDVEDSFQPMADTALKGYITVKHFQSEIPLNIGHLNNNEHEHWTEDKYTKQLASYPQLPIAAHNFLRHVDIDTEILAYFDVEMRLFHKKIVVIDTLAHVVLTKPSEMGLTWIAAFFKHDLHQTEPNYDILAYKSPINRFLNLNVVGNFSLSLESDEQIDECVVFNFQNFQECQRFQSLFSSHKSMNIRKRFSHEHITPEELSEKRAKYNSGSPNKNLEPIAWITKLPPEIAKFHAAPEVPEPKKTRSSDEFIYDSSTFSNALNMNVSEILHLPDGCGKENREESPCNTSQELTNEVNSNDGIIFTIKDVCLLMKHDPESVDYRSPGYGTLCVIKNENNYNQLDFTDNSGALKCRHFIDQSNIVKCDKTSSEGEIGCVWQAFSELFNSPKPLRSLMHFKVVLSTLNSGRFMDAVDDSIAKANRLRNRNRNNEHSSSSTVRYSL